MKLGDISNRWEESSRHAPHENDCFVQATGTGAYFGLWKLMEQFGEVEENKNSWNPETPMRYGV